MLAAMSVHEAIETNPVVNPSNLVAAIAMGMFLQKRAPKPISRSDPRTTSPWATLTEMAV